MRRCGGGQAASRAGCTSAPGYPAGARRDGTRYCDIAGHDLDGERACGRPGDWRAAIGGYREVLVRQTRIQGRDHPVTAVVIESLATALGYEAGTTGSAAVFNEAAALFEEALAIKEARLGRSHPQVGATLDRLGSLLFSRGDVVQASAVQQRAVAILRAAYGEAHPTTVAALGRLERMRGRRPDP